MTIKEGTPVMNFKEAKTHLRAFMRVNYTDERLAWLLAHARSGKLAYNSCCCFIGVATADHALRPHLMYDLPGLGIGVNTPHYKYALCLPGAYLAEDAYRRLVPIGEEYSPSQDISDDELRLRIIIPMVLAEMRRRERSRAAVDKLDAILAEIRADHAVELATA